MHLTRNTTDDGTCKYAAIRNDLVAKLPDSDRIVAEGAMCVLEALGVLRNPRKGEPGEFLLLMAQDINTPAAALAYAKEASTTDKELAVDVLEFGARAMWNPNRKQPD